MKTQFSLDSQRMNDRVTFQRPVVVRSTTGSETTTWADHVTVWATVKDVSGDQRFLADETRNSVETKILVKYRQDITERMRVLYRGRVMDILAIVEPSARMDYLDIRCRRGLADG